jgi:serine/threonine protein kinase
MWNKSFQIHDIVTDHRTGRRYRIERFLDQGAYSEVWLALCLDTGVYYAIKSLKLKHTSDPKTLERNEREGDALFLLNHPNVVRVYCMGKRDDGLIFMVMDLLVGGSLRQRLQTFGGKLPIPWALEIMVSVCDGLEAIHELAIHRDLKPENLHVGEDGWVSLYDLGAAKYPKKSRLTTGGFTIGTVEYMSPEQLGAPGTLDTRSDLYSVGVMLYESLTGVHPHGILDPLTGKYVLPDDAMELGRRIMYQPHRPLRDAAPNVEDYIVEICERLLCKVPKNRIKSAAGASELLAGCLARFRSEHTTPPPLPLSDIGKLAALAAESAEAADASDAENQELPWPASINPYITISQPPSPPQRGARPSCAAPQRSACRRAERCRSPRPTTSRRPHLRRHALRPTKRTSRTIVARG